MYNNIRFCQVLFLFKNGEKMNELLIIFPFLYNFSLYIFSLFYTAKKFLLFTDFFRFIIIYLKKDILRKIYKLNLGSSENSIFSEQIKLIDACFVDFVNENTKNKKIEKNEKTDIGFVNIFKCLIFLRKKLKNFFFNSV